MRNLTVTVDAGREIAEISADFTDPIEVVRESVHNSFDAGATEVSVAAVPQTLPDGRRVLTLEFQDNGIGMSEETLACFFGLGHSVKPSIPGRPTIGFKGHGTKIYYQAQDVYVATRVDGGLLNLAIVRNARRDIHSKRTPTPEYFSGEEADAVARSEKLSVPTQHGTSIRLVDYTPDSSRLIDVFKFDALENYLRWFTIYGSFEHVVKSTTPTAPFSLKVQGTDLKSSQIGFGHPWPSDDRIDIKALKRLDDRRPFNYFRKSFRFPDRSIADGFRIDVAILFEGKRGRLDRDKAISRQRSGGLYAEEERYGLWLCRDFIPVEQKFEWLLEEECPRLVEDLRRPLIFVNSQDFKLIANRGSVGNSPQQLLDAIKQAIFSILEEVEDDKDIQKFLNEYQEDLFGRQRDKDQKALTRRIDRHNDRSECEIKLANGKTHLFFEPKREITLFGLISELQVLDASILSLEILDYDDHSGIDLLVQRNGNPANLLDKTKVSYVELKYVLGAQVNHAFDHLYAVICWESDLKQDDFVTDAANNKFQFEEKKGADGVTSSRLIPLPDSKLTHNVKVIVLKRLLQEKYAMTMRKNPKPISKSAR
jgi:hypothetical protein